VSKKILVIPGDGIGTEITEEALKVLNKVNDKFSLELSFDQALLGGAAFDATGVPLPEETLKGPRLRRHIIRRHRRPTMGQPRTPPAPRTRFATTTLRSGTIRQPASSHFISSTGRCLITKTRNRSRPGYINRARTHRRNLFRRASWDTNTR